MDGWMDREREMEREREREGERERYMSISDGFFSWTVPRIISL